MQQHNKEVTKAREEFEDLSKGVKYLRIGLFHAM
jgi:hypothetical protein